MVPLKQNERILSPVQQWCAILRQVFVFIACLTVIVIHSSAQPKQKDSLKNILTKQISDTDRVDVLNQLAYQYFDFNDSIASNYAHSALELAKQINYLKGIKYAYTMVALEHSSRSEYRQAIRYFRISEQVQAPNADSDASYNLVLLGNCYREMAYYDSAIFFYQKAKDLIKNKNDRDLPNVHKNLASVYLLQWKNKQAIAQLDSATNYLEQDPFKNENKYVQMDTWSYYGRAYKNINRYDLSEKYYDEMCSLAFQLDDYYHQIMCYLNQAELNYQQSEFTSSLKNGFKALEITKKYVFPPQYVKVLLQIGEVYEELAQFDVSADYFYKALSISEKLNLRAETALIYSELAWIKKEQNNYEQAIDYANKSMSLRKSIGDVKGLANCHNVLGLIYMLQKRFSNAISEHEQALTIREQLNYQEGISASIFNLSLVYEELRDFDKAIDFQKKAIAMEEKIGNGLSLAISYNAIARLLLKLNRLPESLGFIDKANQLSQRLGSSLLKRNVAQNYSDYFQKLGDYKRALNYQKDYQAWNDSIYSEESAMKLAEVEALYNVEKKERDIELLEQKQFSQANQLKLQQAELSRKNWIITSTSIGILLLVVGAFIGYRYYREKIRANKELREQQEEIQAQSEELQEANQVISDINKRLEEKVETRTVELKQAYKELDTFFYRSSHDFRRPITTFLGLAGVAKITVKDPVSLELFDKVSETATSLDKMLRKLQSISDLGYQQMIYKEVSVRELVQEVLDGLSDTIHKKGIVVQIEIDEKLPFISYPAMVKIIIENLIENAIHFAGFDKPFVRVTFSVNSQTARFVVVDNGQGIMTEYQNRIFEMYYRANEKSKGNGLGLYIASKAAEKLNGSIYFESKWGEGSTFTVELPKVGA